MPCVNICCSAICGDLKDLLAQEVLDGSQGHGYEPGHLDLSQMALATCIQNQQVSGPIQGFYIGDSVEPEMSGMDVDAFTAKASTSAGATEKEEPLENSLTDADSKPKTQDSDVIMTSAEDNVDGSSQTAAMCKAAPSGASPPDASRS